MEKETFSVKKRIKSFEYAASGIRLLFQTEHNSRLHAVATLAVIILALVVKVRASEGALLAIAVGLVWITELFNTCVEKMMDFISQENHPSIKLIKDIAAGAVLTAALTAVVIGCLVFIPKFF